MFRIVLAGYIAMTLLTIGAYVIDKHRAHNGRWRIRERTLHMLALAGGCVGALIAQQVLRHKRRKRLFVVLTWAIALAHAIFWSAVFLWTNAR